MMISMTLEMVDFQIADGISPAFGTFHSVPCNPAAVNCNKFTAGRADAALS